MPHLTTITAGSESISVSHEHLKCDGPGCGGFHGSNKNPKFRCPQCGLHYYCSKECQRRAWPEHKESCKKDAGLQQRIAQGKEREQRYEESTPINEECAICLETLDVNDATCVVLKLCHHGFCYHCIKAWEIHHQDMQTQELAVFFDVALEIPAHEMAGNPSCPLCRSNNESNVDQAILEKSLLYKMNAHHCSDKDEEKRLLSMALEELEVITGGEDRDFLTDPILRRAYQLKSQILLTTEQFGEALAILNWSLEQEAFGSFAEEMMLKTSKMRALAGMKDYKNALHLAFQLEGEQDGRYVICWALTDYKLAAAELWYQLGNWEMCIRQAESAIKNERFFPGVHKYAALAFRAEGNVAAAVEIMAEAVLHERQERVDIMEENIKLLRQYQDDLKRKGPFLLQYPSKRPSPACAICRKEPDYHNSVILSSCGHQFCCDCLQSWWMQYASDVADQSKQLYREMDASCPACRGR